MWFRKAKSKVFKNGRNRLRPLKVHIHKLHTFSFPVLLSFILDVVPLSKVGLGSGCTVKTGLYNVLSCSVSSHCLPDLSPGTRCICGLNI